MRQFSAILRFLRENNLRNVDDIAVQISDIFDENPTITRDAFKLKIRKVKSDFFRINSLKREAFADQMFHAVATIRERKSPEPTTIKKEYEFVAPDEIDSFRKIRSIHKNQVRRIMPLDLEEEKIKRSLAAIIGEEFIQKDWGGERSDLFTSRVTLRGSRCIAAFMLKGRGTPRKLTIADCGKNGDQILRLVKEPADLFIVQHVREIDSSVVDLLERLVAEKSVGGKKLFYSVIDGIDTAKILVAYKRLARPR